MRGSTSLNYFRVWISDYLKDTGDLSQSEHGAYFMLLLEYYAHGPVPDDPKRLYRICRAITQEDQVSVDTVAERFFPVNGDGRRHNKRADAEIAKARHAIEQMSEAGKRGVAERERRKHRRVPIREPITGTQRVGISGPGTSSYPLTQDLTPLAGALPAVAGGDGQDLEKKRQAQEAAIRAVEYLNQQAGRHFRIVEANVKLPRARILYDGATEADLKSVVDAKVAAAKRGEFKAEYLRPATLFNAEKFAQYVGQLGVSTEPNNVAPLYRRQSVM